LPAWQSQQPVHGGSQQALAEMVKLSVANKRANNINVTLQVVLLATGFTVSFGMGFAGFGFIFLLCYQLFSF